MPEHIVKFMREKVTKNTVRFIEDPVKGQPPVASAGTKSCLPTVSPTPVDREHQRAWKGTNCEAATRVKSNP